MMFAPLLAMVDMRGNLIASAILLVVGVVVFRLVRPPVAASTSRRWLPIVAFVSGPAVAFLRTIADVLWIQPGTYLNGTYLNFAEYLETLVPVLVIGVIGAFAFWVGDHLSRQRVR
jgi:Zn-dependent membrane protease YugP